MTGRHRKPETVTPIFMDTGYIRAALDATDVFHNVALKREATLPHPYRLTTTAVLGECGDRFARYGVWEVFDRWLRQLEGDPFTEIVPVDRKLFDRAVALRRKNLSRWWGITDCMSFVVMKERGITEALSTDSDYTAAGFTALLLDRSS